VLELHSHNNKLSFSLQAFCTRLQANIPRFADTQTPNINFTSNSSDAGAFFMHC